MPKPKNVAKPLPARGRKISSKPLSAVAEDISIAELKVAAAKAKASLEYVRKLFPTLVTLSEDERRTSGGKLRDGEGDALRAVLRLAAEQPTHFTSLATRGRGAGSSTFEARLIGERLDRHETLVDLASEISALHERFEDSVLRIGEMVRAPVLAAYDIAKPLAQRDADVRALLAPAIDFYGGLPDRSPKTTGAKKVRGKAARKTAVAS